MDKTRALQVDIKASSILQSDTLNRTYGQHLSFAQKKEDNRKNLPLSQYIHFHHHSNKQAKKAFKQVTYNFILFIYNLVCTKYLVPVFIWYKL